MARNNGSRLTFTRKGDWSIFRRTDVFCEQTVGRKHGPVPFPQHPQRKGDSPIFAAIEPVCTVTFRTPRKSGQSPVIDRRGFTLIEMLAALTIGSVVLGISVSMLALLLRIKRSGGSTSSRMGLRFAWPSSSATTPMRRCHRPRPTQETKARGVLSWPRIAR